MTKKPHPPYGERTSENSPPRRKQPSPDASEETKETYRKQIVQENIQSAKNVEEKFKIAYNDIIYILKVLTNQELKALSDDEFQAARENVLYIIRALKFIIKQQNQTK